MGEKQGNCIYIDKEGKWWLAETEDIFQGEIRLIEEQTEEINEAFTESFVKFVNGIAPHILFIEEGKENFSGTDAKDRKVVYQS